MSEERINLKVPYLQKDKAKALGARWDRDSKCWWIPFNIDPTPFAQWVPMQDEQLLYRDLLPLDPEEFESYGKRGSVEVVFVPWTCWKCEKETLAFHGAVDRAISITHLLYQPHVLEELDKIRKRMGLDPFGCIKPRFSRTLGSSYVSQGCRHCDALIGEHPLWEDFNEVFSTLDITRYRFRQLLNWSFLMAAETR